MTQPAEQRFWAKVDMTGDCWLWTATTTHDGYGQFYFEGKMVLAHRFAYGTVPKGLVLDHLCRVRNCVNPSHLEAVTFAENVRRGNTGANTRNRTHCPQKHEYTAENTYITPRTGYRMCRLCMSEQNRNRYLRNKQNGV